MAPGWLVCSLVAGYLWRVLASSWLVRVLLANGSRMVGVMLAYGSQMVSVLLAHGSRWAGVLLAHGSRMVGVLLAYGSRMVGVLLAHGSRMVPPCGGKKKGTAYAAPGHLFPVDRFSRSPAMRLLM